MNQAILARDLASEHMIRLGSQSVPVHCHLLVLGVLYKIGVLSGGASDMSKIDKKPRHALGSERRSRWRSSLNRLLRDTLASKQRQRSVRSVHEQRQRNKRPRHAQKPLREKQGHAQKLLDGKHGHKKAYPPVGSFVIFASAFDSDVTLRQSNLGFFSYTTKIRYSGRRRGAETSLS